MVEVCFGILMELLTKEKVTAQYLSEKFEVSMRTIYRYIDVLSYNRIPVYTIRGRNGGIQIADNYHLPASYFTKDEKDHIITALSILDKTMPIANCETIINKFLSMHKCNNSDTLVLGSSNFVIEGGLMGDASLYRNKIEPLFDAVENFKLTNIVYHSREGSKTTRTIEPHAFVLKDLVWYVYGYCHLRQ